MISTGILNIFLECPFCCRTACPPSVWLISLGFPSCWSLCSPSCWLLCPPGLPSYLPFVSDLIFLLVDLVSPLFLFFIPSYFPSCWSLCPPCLPSVSLCLRSCLKVPTTPFHSDDANDADCISCITTLKNHLQHNLKKPSLDAPSSPSMCRIYVYLSRATPPLTTHFVRQTQLR